MKRKNPFFHFCSLGSSRLALRLAWTALAAAWIGLAAPIASVAASSATDAAPRLIFWNGARLLAAKTAYATGGGAFAQVIAGVLAEADTDVTLKPPSVMDKAKLPPSGDKHDYVSQATYWWPDTTKPNGLPYIQKDGQTNPEIKSWPDHDNMSTMTTAVEFLSLAYYLSGKESYASACANYIRVWFLNDATKMNPNLKYAQFIPGLNDGRGTGLIETRFLIDIQDALTLISGSTVFTADETNALKAWFAVYFRWFRDSAPGHDESSAQNNHGTWYDVQAAFFATYIGQDDSAKAILQAGLLGRVAAQILPDGSMPEELKRTRAMHYECFNLGALYQLAALGRYQGVDYWGYQSPDGRSLRKAIDWLEPYLVGDKPWTYQQIDPFPPWEAVPDLLQSADAFHSIGYYQAAQKLKGVDPTQDVSFLLYDPFAVASVLPRPRVEAKRSSAMRFAGDGKIEPGEADARGRVANMQGAEMLFRMNKE